MIKYCLAVLSLCGAAFALTLSPAQGTPNAGLYRVDEPCYTRGKLNPSMENLTVSCVNPCGEGCGQAQVMTSCGVGTTCECNAGAPSGCCDIVVTACGVDSWGDCASTGCLTPTGTCQVGIRQNAYGWTFTPECTPGSSGA